MPEMKMNSSLNATHLVHLGSQPSTSLLVVTAFLGFTSVGGTIGNGLVVCVINRLRNHGKRSNVHRFLFHLAWSDLLVCTLCIPLTIIMNFVSVKTKSVPHSIICKTLRFFQFLSPTISIALLTVISIDRYFAIVKPMNKTPLRRPKWMIIIAWTTSVILFLPTFYLSKVEDLNIRNITIGYCTPIPNNTPLGLGFLMFVALFAFVFPLTTISFMYAKILHFVYFRHRKMDDGNFSRRDHKLFKTSKKKVLKMLLIVVAAFLVCWLPFVVYCGFIEPYTTEFPNPGDVVRIATYCLGLFNSFINPFIYFFSNTILRKSCVDLVCCRKFSLPSGGQFSLNPALSKRFTTARSTSLVPNLNSLRYALEQRYHDSVDSTSGTRGGHSCECSPNMNTQSRRINVGINMSTRGYNQSPLLRRHGTNGYTECPEGCDTPLRGRKQMPTKTTLEGLEKVTCI